MNNDLKKILQEIYADHHLRKEDLDYNIVAKYKDDLNRLSQLNNTCFFIVDLHTVEYVFTSDNFKNIFGYVPSDIQIDASDDKLLDSKIHPDDFAAYKRILPKVGEFILRQSKKRRIEYKHIYEIRILNTRNQYVRVAWERQPLKTDRSGNLWLMLGSIHILPDQNVETGIKSFFINLRTGERIPFNFPEEPAFKLTPREKEVFRYIREGLLSKEIAEKLSVSIHTINIHRQNILKKMNVDNSLEAVNLAVKLGITD